MNKMARYETLIASTLMFLLCSSSVVLAADEVSDHPQHARVRFIGGEAIDYHFYQRKSCMGGDSTYIGTNGRLLTLNVKKLFSKAESVSIGMPDTPTLTKSKNKDSKASDVYFNEYLVSAGEPFTVASSLSYALTQNYGSEIQTTKYTCNANGYFFPHDGKDYEVTARWIGRGCQLSVMQIDSSQAEVELLPVKVNPTASCSSKDVGMPDPAQEVQETAPPQEMPAGMPLKQVAVDINPEVEKSVDEFLEKRRTNRVQAGTYSTQCPDCAKMIESPSGRQELGTLPQTDDAESNGWIKLIQPEVDRYVLNQENYFNLPSKVVPLPCAGAEEYMRKAAGFPNLADKPLEAQPESEHRNSDTKFAHYVRDVLLWPVTASCANGKLEGAVDFWIFGNSVDDSQYSLTVSPVLKHVRYTAANGKPVGLMNIVERSNGALTVEWRNAKMKEQMKNYKQEQENADFTYRQADSQTDPRSVTVMNRIYALDYGNTKLNFEGPTTKVVHPLSPGHTEVITFEGLRKASSQLYKNGLPNGEGTYVDKPTRGTTGLFKKQEVEIPGAVTKKCYKNGLLVNLDPCIVD